MRYLTSKTLFFTTSPRTPIRMIPEIDLLNREFDFSYWNKASQTQFMKTLTEQDFYLGTKSPKDPAFSARDRINRAPKSLGFVDLKPVVALTQAGNEFVYGSRPEEALLRQLLKYQLPSPYHPIKANSSLDFYVKPYLEIIRLIRHFDSVAFDELMLFGMQLTNIKKYDEIVRKISAFREKKAAHKGRYKEFFAEQCEHEIRSIYSAEISLGNITTRESPTQTLSEFIKKKQRNLRDYTDACFRYLQTTEIVTISQSGHSLSIPADRISDVDFILRTIPREPTYIKDESKYKAFLFDSTKPTLFSDDRAMLLERAKMLDPSLAVGSLSLAELKDTVAILRIQKRAEKHHEAVVAIKNYEEYDNIAQTFDGIINKDYYDNPLMFEWNTWRAMTMLDGGDIEGNFRVDDDGYPISTAAGNMADIICDYIDFSVLVEVTLQKGQKQYDNEGEPVARHLGKHKELTKRPVFGLFIAPTINAATIAYFYSLHNINIAHYGGKAIIVPLELAVFRKMIQNSYSVSYVPTHNQIRAIFEKSIVLANSCKDETEWYERINKYAIEWLE